MAVVAGCTLLPLSVFLAWLLLAESITPPQLKAAVALAVSATLIGILVALVLLYHLLTPLRMMADVVEAYYREHRLPQLPEDGRDEVGLLMRGINCGLREIETGIVELQRSVREDPLTHALSRRGSDQALLQCVERAERGMPLALYVLDVDNLKPVNDEHGHVAGDRMLIDLVESSRLWLQSEDWIGRWGGDEFLVCIHEPPPAANARMREWLCALTSMVRADSIPIRISVGGAHYRPGIDAMELYREADAAMYSAKAQGGAKLVSDEGIVLSSPSSRNGAGWLGTTAASRK
ncbi:GGDEF domain-containing protein [Lysobacter sp. Root494]|uniref:GGDEF domain-containing protein n=1 Tax=Lysobacter sp. Root494 TaxID=1736549 RepID=UPI00138F1638|nr:GGDEF domain-containing protein [Lysobacter sp. Root494]